MGVHLHFCNCTESGQGGVRFPCVEQCPAFVVGVVLKTPWCFGYCSAVLAEYQGRHSSLSHQRPVGWRWAKDWNGKQSGHLIPMGIFHTMWCHALQQKLREMVLSWGKGGVKAFVFQSNRYMCSGPALQTVAGHCLLMGIENIPLHFALLLCAALDFLIKLPTHANPWACPFYFLSLSS